MSITSNVDLATLIEDVVESVHAGHAFQNFSLARLDSSLKPQQADKWGVNIIVDFLPSASWVFHVQVGAIRRIVMNILGNSLKYTTSGSIYIRVEQLHTPQSKSRLLRLTIADTGCGISEDYLAHDVFTPFSQEDHMESGSGLGLSIVKRIAEGLRGMVEIQSEIGVGTTVRVSLPLEVGEEEQEAGRAPADIPHPCTLPDEQELSPPQADDLRGLRISLVGFQDCSDENCRGGLLGNPLSEKENMTSICRDWLGLQIIQPYNDYGISPDIALCDEYSFDQAILLTQANKSIPVVVVCQNAVVARRLAAINAQNEATSEQWIHFTYQPLGPRKLAGTLSRTLEHWMSRQSLPKDLILHDIAIKDEFCPLGRDTPITPPVVKEEEIFPIGSAHFQDGQAIPTLCLPHRVLQSPAATPVEKEDPFAPTAERRGTVFLLVDDNPINLKMLSTFMKKLGYPYDTATDGQQAVTSYQQQPERYKCVFMDISMPVMNGFEATRLIRTMEAEVSLPRCTIIALTGLASQESQQEAFVCGIDLFLTKPVKLAEIKQIIEAKHLT
ncbi:hypothetical protein NM208_g15542 [Fusarium decemcellulare]|uniref:Uncharacterized protein n=1 Tax=Fusarium decemcellulare TaxID=57161 RepID=A0ACC1RCQ6_9HYPO|nr:hypothetical protein NM208_g15542 [Fusarium decemcellulare]